MKTIHYSSILRYLLIVLVGLFWHAMLLADEVLSMSADDAPWVHALAMHGTPRYPSDFSNFSYVNPEAPKGGDLRLAAFGDFDSLNPFIIKGVSASGIALIYDTLTVASADEPFTRYGLLAQRMQIPADRSWVLFELDPRARFSDGHPVTAEDVVFSYRTLVELGNPLYQHYYADVVAVEALDAQRVKFRFAPGVNRELALTVGELAILPEHYWAEREFNRADLTIPLGSGPYRIAAVQSARSIVYARNEDYWGKDLPVNRGQDNFDRIRYDYYRDFDVMFEAFKAGDYDLHTEHRAKSWAVSYNFPALQQGRVIKRTFAHQRPQGMQAYALNLRNPLFASRAVREALAYAFDFEWSNRHLFHDSYIRSNSFFANSALAANGLPDAAQQKILQPYRDRLPDDIFTRPYRAPITAGDGNNRSQLRTALKLLRSAGWYLEAGVLRHPDHPSPMRFEILLVQPGFERITQPFIQNLKRLGIEATIRVVDSTQYINRLRTFDFDVMVASFPQSDSPGNEQWVYWGSAAAEQPGSRNYMGIADPVIDALIGGLVAAESRSALMDHARALDRVLLWGHYVIPHWHITYDRVAYWDKFAMPEIIPSNGYQWRAWWAKP